jgi:hypothetical protein
MTQLNQQGIDCCASNKWLNDGQLYPETEGFMMAIQDQVKNMGSVQMLMLFRITNINHRRFWIIKVSFCTGTEQYTPLEPYQTTDPISR